MRMHVQPRNMYPKGEFLAIKSNIQLMAAAYPCISQPWLTSNCEKTLLNTSFCETPCNNTVVLSVLL